MRKHASWLDGFMAYTENTEPPATFRLWTGLCTLSATLGRKVWLPWERDLYPNMYVVLCAPSGKARKGTAMHAGARFLHALGVRVAPNSVTREAMILSLEESADSFLIGDTLHLHHSLTVFSSELSVFIGYNNLQLIADLTDLYDSPNHWEYKTKTKGSNVLEGVCLNILGATTPDLLQATLPKDAVGGGLTSRMVFVYEDRKAKSVIMPHKTQEELRLAEELEHDLKEIAALAGAFKITQGFVECWANWYPTCEAYDPFCLPTLNPYLERRPTHLMKLACICSVARSNDLVIDVQDFEKAKGILTLTEHKMGRTFVSYGRNPSADLIQRIMTVMLQAGTAGISEQRLLQMFYTDVTMQELKMIIDSIEAMGHCKKKVTGQTTVLYYKEQAK